MDVGDSVIGLTFASSKIIGGELPNDGLRGLCEYLRVFCI